MAKQVKFEEALEALEKIVTQLEGQSCTLEETIQLYKEGVELLGHCTQALNKIEKEIIIINEHNQLVEE